MKKIFFQIAAAIYCTLVAITSFAQVPVVVLPTAPNSSDTILVRLNLGVTPPLFTGDTYRVEMVANRIRIILGAYNARFLAPFSFGLYAEIGKLPAGTYAVDAFDIDKTTGTLVLIGSSSSFVVSDGRVGKSKPFVNLNFADHWWNPAESGWGLFIWHDRLDRLLAAWFTYGADNKPVWYTVQGGAWINSFEYEGKIYQTTGPVFSSFTAGSTVIAQQVGTAKLSFSADNTATFTYTLNGVTQTKNITRFKP